MPGSRPLSFLAAVAALALAGGGVAVWALGRRTPTRELAILFTGDTIGRLAACVCDGAFAGGVDYRRTCVARRRAAGGNFLLVDVGGLASGRQEPDLLRLEELLRAMAAMGYQAANVGTEELLLGRTELTRLAGLGVPLVSANLQGTDHTPALTPVRVLELGGRQVAVTGLVRPAALAGPGVTVSDPAAALARLLPTLPPEALVVVLCDLEVAAVRDLARDFPEVGVFLFRGGKDSHPLERVNRSAVMAVAGARYLGELSLTWPAESPHARPEAAGTAVLLDERYAPDALPPTAPAGVALRPEVLAFGHFRRGEVHRARLEVVNTTGGEIRLGRVYSPCTCFAMELAETRIPAGETAPIEVTLHSVELSGRQSFPLFVEIHGAARGLARVTATATVADGDPRPADHSGTGSAGAGG